MLDTSKMSMKQKFILVAALIAIFVFVAVPFKVMSLIPGFTEIRPVNCLQMLFGLIFGVYGAIGCAVGNLISDILGGTLAISSWAGFVSNFLGAYIAHLLWYRLVKKPPLIRNITEVGAFTSVTIIVSVMTAAIFTFGVGISYPDIDLMAVYIQVILNTVVFSLLLGLPLLITATNSYKVTGLVPETIKNEMKGQL